ncbi:unnamed protein product [Fraxinus pennsylvanica]|uniref:Uncharacterized protein n=1 Tax=Fraxinus pennsylvanica TaxID=56036 RepID=A0AAD2DLD9_9LAMI|nr:unnamed protein product [Fraxinus pennsylvanica]
MVGSGGGHWLIVVVVCSGGDWLIAVVVLIATMHNLAVDGVSEWRNPQVQVGDAVIFQHKYQYNLYIFQSQNAFSLCNFSQATLLTKPSSTSYTDVDDGVGYWNAGARVFIFSKSFEFELSDFADNGLELELELAALAAAMNLKHNLAKIQADAMPEHYEAELETRPGEQKLYLFIEGPTEQSVKRAKVELKRALEEITMQASSLPSSTQPGRYSVL